MTILIENLTFDTIIGILEGERVTPQKVVIDCTIDYHYAENSFINYADVAILIQQTIQKKQFLLIEDALTFLGSLLKEQFPSINTLTLTLRKPDILNNCTVGVQQQFIF